MQPQDKYVLPTDGEVSDIYSVQEELKSDTGEVVENSTTNSGMSAKTAWTIGGGVMGVAGVLALAYGLQEKDARPEVADTGLNTKPAIVEEDQTGFQRTLEERLAATAEATGFAVLNPTNEAMLAEATLIASTPTAAVVAEAHTATPTPTVQAVAAEPATPTAIPTNTAVPTPVPATETPSPVQDGSVVPMDGENLNLRNSAGEAVGRIPENSQITVSGITADGKWFLVTTPDQKVGYASTQYINVASTANLPVIAGVEIEIASSTGIGGAVEPTAAAVAAAPAAVNAPAGNPVFPNVEQVPSAIGVEGLKPGEAVYNFEGFVETATNVLKATGEFKNTLGLGTEAYLAEPGVVMISDFIKADGTFDAELAKAYAESEGRIELINPSNQEVFNTELPEFFKIPEGGFTLVSGKTFRIDLPDGRYMEFAGGEGVVWNTVIRGWFGDSTTDTSVMNTDRHQKPMISNYVGGHTMATVYPEGAFISQGHYEQIIQLSHLDEDCGDGGCSRAMNAYVDTNTGGYEVWEHNYVTGKSTLIAKNY